MPRVDKEARADVGHGQASPPVEVTVVPAVLATDEELVLQVLLSCEIGATAAQLTARSSLNIEQVTAAVQSLRAKGLVICLNTVVESYAARFPGISVS